jgi:hypothetical protein
VVACRDENIHKDAGPRSGGADDECGIAIGHEQQTGGMGSRKARTAHCDSAMGSRATGLEPPIRLRPGTHRSAICCAAETNGEAEPLATACERRSQTTSCGGSSFRPLLLIRGKGVWEGCGNEGRENAGTCVTIYCAQHRSRLSMRSGG